MRSSGQVPAQRRQLRVGAWCYEEGVSGALASRFLDIIWLYVLATPLADFRRSHSPAPDSMCPSLTRGQFYWRKNRGHLYWCLTSNCLILDSATAPSVCSA